MIRVRLEIPSEVFKTLLYVKLALRKILKALKELNIACLEKKKMFHEEEK